MVGKSNVWCYLCCVFPGKNEVDIITYMDQLV